MNCPDCDRGLMGDGSCCDYCGWAMVGGGDDPRLPSKRTPGEIFAEERRRSIRRALSTLEEAGSLMRHACATIGTLPDTLLINTLHNKAGEIETSIRHLQSRLESATFNR